MSPALQAFRAADFNWTHALQGVWSDAPFQVDELHRELIDNLVDDFLRETRAPDSNPIGRVVLGRREPAKPT